jgi:hypothetical protein
MKALTLALLLLLSKNLVAATYGVPVPENLAAFGHFNLTGAHAKITGRQLEVTYSLPQELVGTNRPPLTFKGILNEPFVAVKGTNVGGICMVLDEQPLTCMLRYPNRIIDEPSRADFLKDTFSGLDLFSHEQVARFFSNDPAGILSIEVER